jgi:hypothetical protein
MKLFTEYLELVRNGIKNGDKIIEALMVSAQVKNGKISDEALAEIMRRKEICAGCQFNSDNAKRDRNYNSYLPFTHCTLCKCRIGGNDTKEYCLTCNCGALAWNERNPDKKPMELKWKAFEVKDDTTDNKKNNNE